jgi:hypothetical protein
MNIQQVNEAVLELQDAFNQTQQPKSDYALKHFVVGRRDTEPIQYTQCVNELLIRHGKIRRYGIAVKKLKIEIERLQKSGDEIDALSAEEKLIDIEDFERATLGELREFACLYRIFMSFSHRYTYDELQEAYEEDYHRKLVRQTDQAIRGTGHIGAGNLEALRQAGLNIQQCENGVYFISPALDRENGTHALSTSENGGL